MVQKLNGHTDFVKSVAFSPCGKYIVSGSRNYLYNIMLLKYLINIFIILLGDKSIQVWELKSSKMV